MLFNITYHTSVTTGKIKLDHNLQSTDENVTTGLYICARDIMFNKQWKVHISPVAFHKAHELMSNQNAVHIENSRLNCL